MTIASLTEALGLKQTWEAPGKELPEEHLDDVQAASASLAASIRDGTITAEQIDSFLQDNLELLPVPKQQPAHEFFLSKKAGLVSKEGKLDQALQLYDEALRIKETPSTWGLRGSVLLQLERLDEAFGSFREAYSLREEFGDQKEAYLEDLIGAWSTTALLRGLFGILEQDIREAEKGAFEYIQLLSTTKANNLAHLVLNLAVESPVSEELQEALDELELMVRLLSIEDPFDGWRAVTKEISKVWPKGVSAVDAVREQRE